MISLSVLVSTSGHCSNFGHLNIKDEAEVRPTKTIRLPYFTYGLIPKIHGMLGHAYTQMEQLGGFGDLLEDDLEHLHQT
jgi:hypothetical protein